MCFIFMMYLNLDIAFSSEILDLYLELIKFSIERVNLHTQIVPDLKVLQ